MDFTNFAPVEFVGAVEAQREHDRNQRKWLVAWHDLRRAADERKASEERAARSASTRPAA